MDRKEFVTHLNAYYKSLTERLDKGYKYLDTKPFDAKAVRVYNTLVDELSQVESLINFYKSISNKK